MYRIEFSPSALKDIGCFRRFAQEQIFEAIEKQLPHQPAVETRNRKRLRPNKTAAWELRVGKFRVFYNLEEDSEEPETSEDDPESADEESRLVRIEAVGMKLGNSLLFRGEKREL